MTASLYWKRNSTKFEEIAYAIVGYARQQAIHDCAVLNYCAD
jgi:hypothetical protein